MKQKKGQITVFIIIGILIFSLAGIIFYANYNKKTKTIKEEIEIQESTSFSTNYASIKTHSEKCIKSILQDAIFKFGLEEDKLRNYVSSNFKSCIDDYIYTIKEKGAQVITEEFSMELDLTKEAIIISVSYPIEIINNKKNQVFDEFYHRFSLTQKHTLELDSECKAVKEQVIYSPDMHNIIRIPKGTVAKTKDGSCLNEFSIRIEAVETKLSVFKVNYNFLPDGATFDPYFKVEMKYSQEVFEEVKKSLGTDFKEENIAVAFYDEQGKTFRPYEDFSQSVDTENNIVYAQPNHFTHLYTLTGCGGSETVKWYYSKLGEAKGMEIDCEQIGCNECFKQGDKNYLCMGAVNEEEFLEWKVNEMDSCHSQKDSVEIWIDASPGDIVEIGEMEIGGEKTKIDVEKLTSSGEHKIPFKVKDNDRCTEEGAVEGHSTTGGVCAYANVWIRIEGFGAEVPDYIGNMSGIYSDENPPPLSDSATGIDGEKCEKENEEESCWGKKRSKELQGDCPSHLIPKEELWARWSKGTYGSIISGVCNSRAKRALSDAGAHHPLYKGECVEPTADWRLKNWMKCCKGNPNYNWKECDCQGGGEWEKGCPNNAPCDKCLDKNCEYVKYKDHYGKVTKYYKMRCNGREKEYCTPSYCKECKSLNNKPCEKQLGVCNGSKFICSNDFVAVKSKDICRDLYIDIDNYQKEELNCSDNLDNDCDGKTDLNDTNCFCGNGKIDEITKEECDDANINNTDYCFNNCTINRAFSY